MEVETRYVMINDSRIVYLISDEICKKYFESIKNGNRSEESEKFGIFPPGGYHILYLFN